MDDDYDDAIKEYKIAKVELAGAWQRLIISVFSLLRLLVGFALVGYGLWYNQVNIEIIGLGICIVDYIDYRIKKLEG